MMTLQLVSDQRDLLEEIATFLLKNRLIANAMISETQFLELDEDNPDQSQVMTHSKYILKGISKSLLFHAINKELRASYAHNMPLVYSEPIILIDPDQTERIITKLRQV
ncbi:MAG: hypothetical protein ABNH00_10795 [Dokdonia sp.]|jgi:hypothetical protein